VLENFLEIVGVPKHSELEPDPSSSAGQRILGLFDGVLP
jgi:hypothetical protein